MVTKKWPLARLNHEHGKTVIDEASGLEVFHAPSPHALIQAAGYLKYIRATEAGKGVFFRGQTKLYDSLGPSLLRDLKDNSPAVPKRREILNKYLVEIDEQNEALKSVPSSAREALLQHYGIRTTWVDVVDNVWIALWFACHHARSASRGVEEYLHFEKRCPGPDIERKHLYAYILLIESAQFGQQLDSPGHYKDDRSETIDLRVAVPSHFVRPHAQHGILIRRLSKTGRPVCDFGEMHVGTVRVDLAAALEWLGNAATLTCHSLFPPAYYDYGYRELLEFIRPNVRTLGAIQRIQP